MKNVIKVPGSVLKGPVNAVARADETKTFAYDDEAGVRPGAAALNSDDTEVFGMDTDDTASAKPDGKGGGNGGGNGGGKGKGKPKDEPPADEPPADDPPADDPPADDPPADDPPADDPPSDGLLTTYTSGGDAATSYNIDIEFSGTWTVELQQAFIDAANYLSSIILGDVTDTTSGIDDIVISASLVDIDGSGGVLGRAGPTSIRGGTYLSATGIMEFDVADAETFNGRGLWDDIVLHEMMHAMGFGTLWGYMGLTAGTVEGGDIRFIGEMANEAYARLFPDLDAADGFDFGIPVETDGGPGTAGGHWDEVAFVNEIMTGFINSGGNYISEMTIAALEDMGYDTVLDNPNDANDLTGTMPADDPLAGAMA